MIKKSLTLVIILAVVTVIIVLLKLISFDSYNEANIYHPEQCYIKKLVTVSMKECNAALLKDATDEIDKLPVK